MSLVRKALTADRIDRYRNRKPAPRKGIPQGSPLAPVLSNLYLLDQFDRSVARKGVVFVRYADDALLLVKPKKEDETMKTVNKAVQALGLKLKESKTKVYDLDAGERFEFLGVEGTREGDFYHKKARLELMRRRLGRN